MRESWTDNVLAKASANGPKLRVTDGAFDRIDAETGSIDLVMAAQAFHWVGGDHQAGQNAMVR